MTARAPRALTVTLNAAVDKTYRFDRFSPGAINLVGSLSRVAGGKGNNVARVLARLGVSVTATGFAGGHAGAFIEGELRRLGIAAEFEPIPGESRTCLVLVDEQGRSLTEIREPGPSIAPAEADRFLERFTRLAAEARAVVLSGSLPPGLPTDFYARLVAAARAAGAFTVLDTSGAALRAGLSAGPDLVKPNREELAAWAGRPLTEAQALLAAAEAMRQAGGGTGAVAVSVGAEGLLYIGPDGAWTVTPPAVAAINPVGSGDSAVAGIVAGLLEGRPLPEALRLGVACGTANAMTDSVASVDPAQVIRIEQETRSRSISPK